MGGQRQRNFNFRQTRSERSAEGAYSNYRKGLIRLTKMESIKLKIKNRFSFTSNANKKDK